MIHQNRPHSYIAQGSDSDVHMPSVGSFGSGQR